jgi:UDP-glucose 4-epimerase
MGSCASTSGPRVSILVMGASGLVGGRLLAALCCEGAIRVRAASRVPRIWPAGVEGVVTDSATPDTLIAACEGMDVVVNLASMSEAASAVDPRRALCENAGGTFELMRAAISSRVARFVQLSTSKVYGHNLAGVVTEETVTRPVSYYAITHRSGEDYAMLHPDSVVLRLANGFGAPIGGNAQCWSVMVNDFCRQAVTTHRITIRSDGMAWRNFIALDNVILALGAAATNLPSGIYNLGSPTSTTIRMMAQRVAAACERVLGFGVAVSVGISTAGTQSGPLDYRTDRLRDAGVSFADSSEDEILRTLIAASALFAGVTDG